MRPQDFSGNLPEPDEFVVVSVNKVMPYGAFCTLDEYQGLEAFLHISEVSSGWIRNIREHVKEGQKLVCKIIRVDREKRQIDLSLKRVTEGDKKKKLEGFQNEKRAHKMLEHVALKQKKTLQQAMREAGIPLVEKYGDLYSAFEAISAGELPPEELIPKAWLEAITETAKQEIKPKEVSERAELSLQSFAGDGLARIKKILAQIPKLSSKGVEVSVHYLGAPRYYIDVVAPDHKAADKVLTKAEQLLESSKKDKMEYELVRTKK